MEYFFVPTLYILVFTILVAESAAACALAYLMVTAALDRWRRRRGN